MFPMVTSLSELVTLRAACERIRPSLNAAPIPLGIMIEVPAAAAMADRLAPHADFFSIGTNDLTQYVLAIDRQHPDLAAQADSLHPAVLRLIKQTVDGAHAHGIWVGVCGGLAGDPQGAAILAGLGRRRTVDEPARHSGGQSPPARLDPLGAGRTWRARRSTATARPNPRDFK